MARQHQATGQDQDQGGRMMPQHSNLMNGLFVLAALIIIAKAVWG